VSPASGIIARYAASTAAYALPLAGRLPKGQGHLEKIRRLNPAFRVEHLLSAMQIEPEGGACFRDGAKRLPSAA